MTKKSTILVSCCATVAAAVSLLLLRPNVDLAQPDLGRVPPDGQTFSSTNPPDQSSALSLNTQVRDASREVIGSIYEADLAFRKAAQSTAEDFVASLNGERFVRWQVVRIEAEEFLKGNYLEEGSVPQSFTISPFPDQTFEVKETRYKIRDSTESVSWSGEIVGTEAGRVEITIVGGDEGPGLVIRIFNGPQIIAVLPTEMPEVYVSLEGNPHAAPPIL